MLRMDTEHIAMTEPVRRIEVFTGTGPRRSWSAEGKAQMVAETLRPHGHAAAAASGRRRPGSSAGGQRRPANYAKRKSSAALGSHAPTDEEQHRAGPESESEHTSDSPRPWCCDPLSAAKTPYVADLGRHRRSRRRRRQRRQFRKKNRAGPQRGRDAPRARLCLARAWSRASGGKTLAVAQQL